MIGLYLYLFYGLGFYTGMAVKDPLSFATADLASIFRGLLLGLFFWPIGLIVAVYLAMEK